MRRGGTPTSMSRLCGMLLTVATRRWPAGLRAELHDEWQAEIHVLVSEGSPVRALRFAASLAVRRGAQPMIDRRIGLRILAMAIGLTLAPVAGIACILAGVIVRDVLDRSTRVPLLVEPLFLPGVIGVCAVGLAVLAGRGARRSLGPAGTGATAAVVLAVGVTFPVVVAAIVLTYAFTDGSAKTVRIIPELLWWLAGMVAVLWGAGTLSRHGRTRAAWWLGVLGAVLVADAAVVITVVSHVPAFAPPDEVSIDRLSAPLWLFVSLFRETYGLAGLKHQDVFILNDLLELTPLLYLACVPYAVSFVVNAFRPARADGPAVAAPMEGVDQ